jgi:hypothetical protein
MKIHRVTLIAASLLGVWAVTGCDYAKKSEVVALRAELRATHDTLVALWETLARVPMPKVGPGEPRARGVVPPVPPCPPKCEDFIIGLLPNTPSRMGP